MPQTLLDYIRPPMELDDGTVIPAHRYSQDDDACVRALLERLRDGALIASARGSANASRFDVPADYWQSVAWPDVDWEMSCVPAHKLFAIEVRSSAANRTVKDVAHEMGAPNKRGPKPVKLEQAIDAMRRDYPGEEGKRLLEKEKQEHLKTKYGLSRGTVVRARDVVLRRPPAP